MRSRARQLGGLALAGLVAVLLAAAPVSAHHKPGHAGGPPGSGGDATTDGSGHVPPGQAKKRDGGRAAANTNCEQPRVHQAGRSGRTHVWQCGVHVILLDATQDELDDLLDDVADLADEATAERLIERLEEDGRVVHYNFYGPLAHWNQRRHAEQAEDDQDETSEKKAGKKPAKFRGELTDLEEEDDVAAASSAQFADVARI